MCEDDSWSFQINVWSHYGVYKFSVLRRVSIAVERVGTKMFF